MSTFSGFSSLRLSPGEGTEPATPVLPEDTGKEDAKETFRENKGMDGTLVGKIDDRTLWITIYHGYVTYFVLSCSYLKSQLDRASVTLQKVHEVLGFVGEATGEKQTSQEVKCLHGDEAGGCPAIVGWGWGTERMAVERQEGENQSMRDIHL